MIYLVDDIAKRCGIHRVQAADEAATNALIERGEARLNVTIGDKAFVFAESCGDYWLTGSLCQTICVANDVTQTSADHLDLTYDPKRVRDRMATRLQHFYYEAVKKSPGGGAFDQQMTHILSC